MNKKYLISILCLFFIVGLYFYSRNSCVEIIKQAWRYDKGQCTVSFSVKNNTNSHVKRKVKITAYKQRNIGKGAIVSDVIGGKVVLIDLKPNEIVDLEETVKMLANIKPNMVAINLFKVK
jgi:hypothetical protein